MKILLAVDGSEFGNAAAEAVAKRPWPGGSEVKIICAVEPFYPYMTESLTFPADFWDDVDSTANTQANAAIERAKQYFATPDAAALTVSSEVLKGNPRNAILDEAEAWGADLIVLGSHGYTGLKRVLLGSVSQAVAAHAKCSVEIVRQPAEEKE